ncbi:MAG: HYR domain-containing protein, partial [Chitinophagaceae bacterium]
MSLPRNSKSRTFLAGLAVLCLQLAGISGASAQSSYPQFIDTGHPAADSAAYNAALEQYDQQKASGAALQRTRPVLQAPRDASRPPAGARQTAAQSCLIPRDASWTRLAVGDDNSSTVIPLGFTFNLYGVAYNSVFVNNNGNLTFTSAYSSFSSTGFPFAGMPMVAPFWADVDTRGNSPVGCGGGVYYKNFGTRFVVTWEAVGYYSGQCDKKNTFQVVISDGADPVVGLGQNVKFNYGDMNWTTGSASGGSAGFGGTPATAGVNKGTGGNFIQTGRFGFAGTAYDGGGGATDGVDYLDYECYSFNVSNADNIPPSFSGLPNGNTLTLGCGETATLTVSALGPEVNQYVTNSVDLNGLCGATASVSGGQAPGAPSTATVQITASSCNIGTHTIEFSATDNGTPSRTSTVTVTVIVTGPEMPVISGPSETCPAGTVTLTASGGSAYRWNSGDSSASINVHPGTYSVQSIAGGCASAPASFVVASADHSAPVPVQATLPVLNGECSVTATAPQATDDCSGLINATSNDPLSYTAQGTYTIHWTYTDATGNSTQQEQTVIVKDNTPPVIACAFNVTVNAAANSCGAVVNYNAPSATDNCGSGSLPTSIPGYTYKGTFGGHTYFLSNSVTTPEDAHARAIALGGHLVTISNAQENAFVSAMNPAFIWIGHTDRAVEGDFRWVTSEPVTYTNWNGGEPNNAGGNEDWAVINWGPNGTWNDWFYSENALYVVEFEGGNIPTHLVSGLGSGANFPIGTTTETWEAVDAGGNRAVCSFTVTVVDAQAPTVICPANRSINLQSNCTVAMPDYRGLLQASDNCNGALNIVQSPAPGTLLSGTGALFVNFTVRDAANNSAFCSFRLTKRDVTRPVLNVPANVTVTAPSGTCSIAASAVALGEATATDTCSMATVTRNPLPDQFPVGSTPVYYTAVDASGNGTQGVQIVTVLSMDAPVLAATPAITTSNDAGTCGAFVDVATPKATAFCANNECRSENMDGFTAGDISGQSPYFTPWPGGFGGTVSSDYAFSAPNSMRLANDQDQLYLLGDKTSGKWELTWKMYVPEGRFAYFNSQKFAGSIGTEFGHEVRFFSNGTGSARTPAATTTFSFPHGAWFEVRHSYDLDANTATLYINGNAVQTWTLSDRIGAVNGPGSKQLGAIDFYAGNNPDDLAAPEYYIDDIRFCGSNDAIVSG